MASGAAGSTPGLCTEKSINMNSAEEASAITVFEQAIASNPHSLAAYDGLGWFYLSKLGDFARAIQVYKCGLTANPANPLLTAYLGSTYARMGQTEKALEILEQSAREQPEQVFAPSWLSYLYLRLNRLEEAAACCRREIELRDGHSPHRVLGFIDQLTGRTGEAIVELERAVELEAQDYEARAALARLYRDKGNLPEAEHQFNTGKEMSLEDHEAGLACFHAVYGDVEQALDLLEIACARGQISPGWLRIDPELFFIQDEERFQALINQS
jgi:tetratricopeptide (TPR) repeat protein